ncbi:single-stranded DNA-binding protein [Galbibacter sp. PAP.153]|uniref:single-stranded DNA-binding protein n=1 Tax=Galbibacter sp. PAP.153 TaxID=3104623 RepID=UPI00300A7499
MSNFRNQVQLIGNVGEDPKITLLDGDRKVANFPMATNEYYTNTKGEKVQNTDWHQIVAWGKTADILEKYTAKGSEIGVRGKIKTRSYTTENGNQRYVTEVVADEVLLMGSKPNNDTATAEAQKPSSSKRTSTKKDA